MTTKHVITLQPPITGVQLYICCSCSDEPIARVGFGVAPASLVEVNEIAHSHIQAAEGPEPAFEPLHAVYQQDGPQLGAHIRRALGG